MQGQVIQLLSLQPGAAARTTPMDYNPRQLRQDRFLTAADLASPALTYFPAPAATRNGTAVVICPGGGYGGQAVDREGYVPARWFNSLGISAFVLRYRLPHGQADVDGPPAPLVDLQQAIVLVRRNARSWGLDAKRVGVMGWSAGGHLASMGGTLFHPGPVPGPDGAAYSDRPDFLILLYPVITMGAGGHPGSRDNLLGRHPSAAALRRYSTEVQVGAATPPTFLAVARDDDVVPMANSVLFADACRQWAVPVTLKVYAHGGHGFGMGLAGTDSAGWPDALVAWARDAGLLARPGS